MTDDAGRLEGIGGGGGVGSERKRAGRSEKVGRRILRCMFIVRSDLLA